MDGWFSRRSQPVFTGFICAGPAILRRCGSLSGKARYPVHRQGLDLKGGLQEGVRCMGSDGFARKIWGLTREEYFTVGRYMAVKPSGGNHAGGEDRRSPCPAQLRGDRGGGRTGLCRVGSARHGIVLRLPGGTGRSSIACEVVAANERVLAAANAAGVAFLNNVLPDNVISGIDGGIDIAAGGSREAAEIGRKHTRRSMPW